MAPSVAPGVAELLERLEQAGHPPLSKCSPQELRDRPSLMRLVGPAPCLHRQEDLLVPTPWGTRPARVYVPEAQPQGLIVYLHGGGWTLGSVAEWDTFTATLAQRTRCAVLSIDYRLAPEHPHPAALDDARSALEWATQEGTQALGLAPNSLLVAAGDSAGANLVTVALRHLHAGPKVRRYDLQVLVYPVTDSDFDTPSYLEFAEGKLLTRADMQWFWGHYVPDASQREHPDVAPLRAARLADLPETLILTAALDPLRDEGERYAQALRAHGVKVELHRCGGLIHGFLGLITRVPEAAQAFDRIVAAIAR